MKTVIVAFVQLMVLMAAAVVRQVRPCAGPTCSILDDYYLLLTICTLCIVVWPWYRFFFVSVQIFVGFVKVHMLRYIIESAQAPCMFTLSQIIFLQAVYTTAVAILYTVFFKDTVAWLLMVFCTVLPLCVYPTLFASSILYQNCVA